MSRPSAISAVALLALLVGPGPGCVGEESASGEGEPKAAAVEPVPASLLDSTWPVRLSDDALRAPFEGGAGWAAVFQRDYAGALTAFQAAGDAAGTARMHVELAALHHQAALLSANSTIHVYGNDRQDVDPAAVTYLVAASHGLKGDCAAADKALAALSPTPAQLEAGAAWWRAAIEQGCPDLSLDALPALPGVPGAVIVGTVPEVGPLPHYSFAEPTDEGRMVSAGDPTTLRAVAAWHEAAAVAAGADPEVVAQLLAPWTIRTPAAPSAAVPLDDAWLFGSFLLAPADAAFLAAARSTGAAAVDAWAATSPLAAAVAPAVQGDQLDVEEVIDLAPAVGRQLRDAMAARSGGTQGFHEPFASLGRVAVLRAGMVVADGAGQSRDAGILRINALEQSSGPAADPIFTASVAAWDAGNRNPLRAQEIMHQLVGEFPALAAARYPLDAMHIRLSRNAAPATPVH
jgi:hypothetical protein